MGHIRLGTLPQSKKWRDVIGLLDADAPLDAIAEAAARRPRRICAGLRVILPSSL